MRTLKAIANLFILIRKGVIIPIWSIMVFYADDLVHNSALETDTDTPTLQASDVSDVEAEFVADPFIIRNGTDYFLFFEVLNKATGLGEVGFAKSVDGWKWEYGSIVLREKFHLSYPQVFESDGGLYMLPETSAAGRVILYKAVDFPDRWERTGELLSGHYLDPSLVQYGGRWWLFAGTTAGNLHLFYADRVEGPWIEHPRSPITVGSSRHSRPGGRIVVTGDSMYRYTQDGSSYYGKSVRMFKVNKLTETEYEDEEILPVLCGTNKKDHWRQDGMHHIDQLQVSGNRWLVAVDGHRFRRMNYFAWRTGRFLARINNLKRTGSGRI